MAWAFLWSVFLLLSVALPFSKKGKSSNNDKIRAKKDLSFIVVIATFTSQFLYDVTQSRNNP